jgi:hypothetical protein
VTARHMYAAAAASALNYRGLTSVIAGWPEGSRRDCNTVEDQRGAA